MVIRSFIGEVIVTARAHAVVEIGETVFEIGMAKRTCVGRECETALQRSL